MKEALQNFLWAAFFILLLLVAVSIENSTPDMEPTAVRTHNSSQP